VTTATQRQFLVKVTGIDGYFATKTGGEVEGDVTTVYDGGSLRPEKLGGPAVPGQVVVSRPYKPERDAAVARKLRPQTNRWRTTVSVQPTDADLVALPIPPTVYTDALLVRVSDPEHDAASGDAARLELAFDPSEVV
jgi:hypothetical protein